ncbi:MAG: phosphohydrolase, partial [Candidatus Cloacimonetes bacterium]|nr:phosphohydrolase [Candidatus Cloacimonadota bacterium]
MNISVKQQSLERQILKNLTGRALEVVQFVFTDPEIQALQDYANTVSIKRLGYNDHGPVHMRKTA